MDMGVGAHIFGYILKNIGLQSHIHVDRPRNPAQLALPNVEHAINPLGLLASNLCALPRLGSHLFYRGFDLGESQKVHVAILLLVRPLLVQGEGVKRLVGRVGSDGHFLREIA